MSKVPFRDQILPIDYLLSAQTNIKAGKSISGDDLLRMIDQCSYKPLPEAARDVLRRAIVPAVKARGRPSKFGAALDIALDKVDKRYPALLRHEQRKKNRLLKSGKVAQKGDSPSLLAYERLLRHMKDEFGPMTPEGFKNMHSAWRTGRFHPNDTDSDDFDAEIDRLFPSSKNHE
jgi:hypothetical protein